MIILMQKRQLIVISNVNGQGQISNTLSYAMLFHMELKEFQKRSGIEHSLKDT